AQLDNRGTLNVAQTLTLDKSSAAHSNSGTITLSGGDLTVSQSGASPSFTNTGTITAGSGRTFAVAGGTFTQNVPGSLGGPGTLALQAYATGNFSSYTFFSNPHVTASNSTINLVGSFTTPQLSPFIGSGGLVNLIGTLNNLGNTFTLTAANDVWKLHG